MKQHTIVEVMYRTFFIRMHVQGSCLKRIDFAIIGGGFRTKKRCLRTIYERLNWLYIVKVFGIMTSVTVIIVIPVRTNK